MTTGMTLKQVTQEIKKAIGNDGIFGATFVKQDGSLRTGAFRLGVKPKGTRAPEAPGAKARTTPVYDPEEKGIITAFDMNIQEYRAIKLENVWEIKAGGRVFRRLVNGTWTVDGEAM